MSRSTPHGGIARFRVILPLSLAIALAAPAGAQLRKLGWGDTTSGTTDLSARCNALPDESVLVSSFVAPHGIGRLERIDGYIDFCTIPYDLPVWWRFDLVGGCRFDSLSVSVDFSNGPFTHRVPWPERTAVQLS